MKVHGVLVLVVVLLVGADKKEGAAQTELKKFQGEWVVASLEVNGKAARPEDLKDLRLTFQGNKVTRKLGDMTAEGTITLDPTQKPKQLDGTAKDPDGKEVKAVGIYQFVGKRLK